MKKTTLLPFILLAAIFITACGGTPSSVDAAPQTQPEPATPAQALPQPTDTPPPAQTEALVEEAAASETEAPASAGISFANDVVPIFEQSCIKCHGVESRKEGLDMLTYENILAGSRNGPVLIPGNSADSLLVQLVVEGEMPNRGPKLSSEQIRIISDWVDQGALNN